MAYENPNIRVSRRDTMILIVDNLWADWPQNKPKTRHVLEKHFTNTEQTISSQESLFMFFIVFRIPGWQQSLGLAGAQLGLELLNHFTKALFGSCFCILSIFKTIIIRNSINLLWSEIFKILWISSKYGFWKCKPIMIQTQVIPIDSSQCPVSIHVSPVSPLCERPIFHSIRSIRRNLESIDLNGGVATRGFL